MIAPQPVVSPALVRWCRECASPVTAVGSHHANGDFDPYSVMVSDAEIEAAMSRPGRHNPPEKTRWNIAFGKHIGSYKVLESHQVVLAQRAAFYRGIAAAWLAFGASR